MLSGELLPALAADRPDGGPGAAGPGTARPAGAGPETPAYVVDPDKAFSSNLATSIAMFALFPPFALPATIDAYRARVAERYGEHGLAEENAAESRKWAKSALIFGLISWTLLLCCGGGGLLLRGCGVAS